MTVVTLSTDFGTADYASGLLHGVVAGFAPHARIVNLCHDIPRHDILFGARLLERAVPYFPPGTIHVGVVDPGVGTDRRPMAARIGNQVFVGPDNGLITFWHQKAITRGETVHLVNLNRKKYWLADVSNIFHGRDIFASVAGHLAAGASLDDVGEVFCDPRLLQNDLPRIEGSQVLGKVEHIDHFGNLSTNIPAELIQPRFAWLEIVSTTIDRLDKTFGDRKAGELVALIDSSGYLAIGVTNGSAANRLAVTAGCEIKVVLREVQE
ncbi:MAG: SAM-dependent chlorinase/fluorinase [Anaerolineae bacterium]|nr:SAM-dependent chlorinase/fluorinase [Anaerolineae bacterium]